MFHKICLLKACYRSICMCFCTIILSSFYKCCMIRVIYGCRMFHCQEVGAHYSICGIRTYPRNVSYIQRKVICIEMLWGWRLTEVYSIIPWRTWLRSPLDMVLYYISTYHWFQWYLRTLAMPYISYHETLPSTKHTFEFEPIPHEVRLTWGPVPLSRVPLEQSTSLIWMQQTRTCYDQQHSETPIQQLI